MLQVGCGSVGLIFPCAIIGVAKNAVATTKNRKFFIWTSSLVSVLENVTEKRCEYIYQIEFRPQLNALVELNVGLDSGPGGPSKCSHARRGCALNRTLYLTKNTSPTAGAVGYTLPALRAYAP